MPTQTKKRMLRIDETFAVKVKVNIITRMEVKISVLFLFLFSWSAPLTSWSDCLINSRSYSDAKSWVCVSVFKREVVKMVRMRVSVSE